MVDMFASPGNTKFPKFFSRHPHWEAVGVDSLNADLQDITFCYSNPPWTIIRNRLHRLLLQPQMICWMVVPYWVSSSWFPLLRKLIVPKTPVWKVLPFTGMFSNCFAESMPKPKWPLLFVCAQGNALEGTNTD